MVRPTLMMALVLLSGCASLSKEECKNADWFLIGFGDGSIGRPVNTVDDHRKACAKINVTPDLTSYERGHRKGLTDYCTAENGFVLGNGGGQYNEVCTRTNENSFLDGYHAGKDRFKLRATLDELAAQRDKGVARLEEINNEISDYEGALVGTGSTPAVRRELLQAIRILQDEEAAIESSVDLLDYDLNTLQHQLNGLIYRQRSLGYP